MWLRIQSSNPDINVQMSMDIDGISAIVQQSQAQNASQQSLHAAAQAFEQVQLIAECRFRTQALPHVLLVG